MSRIVVPSQVGEYREGLSRSTWAMWRDDPEQQDRPLWEMFPPKLGRCPSCQYRLDSPGHKNSMH